MSVTQQQTALQVVTQDYTSVPGSDTISFVTALFSSETIWAVIYTSSHKTEEDKICHKTY